MATQPRIHISPEDYLTTERAAEMRSEYHDGEVFAMAGASYAHNLIVANLIAALRPRLRGGSCAVLPSDLRLWIEASRRYVYPDVTVVCGDPRFTDEHRDTLTNPIVLVEVLSKATEAYDRGEKFELYRTLPSFAEYLLFAQDRPHCEHFVRQPGDRWLLTEEHRLDVPLELASIGCELTLEEVYEEIPWSGGPRRL